jgi:UDP-glucose 4-epimerase
MLFIWTHSGDRVNYYNVAVEDQTTVREIAEIVVAALGLEQVKFEFAGGERGWPGDVPRSKMRTEKLAALGWRASRTSREAVAAAAAELVQEYRAAKLVPSSGSALAR